MFTQRFVLVGALACSVVGCSGGSKTQQGRISENMPPVEYPEWVNKGSGAFHSDGKKVLFGVGSASGIRNASLARSTSDNRARSEIAKVFDTYSASLMKDFSASTSVGDGHESSEEQHVQEAIKTYSGTTLNGVEIVDHWIHPISGELYSLARLDMQSFADQLDRSKELSGRAKEAVKRSADKAFQELDAEGAKHAPEAPVSASPSPPPSLDQEH